MGKKKVLFECRELGVFSGQERPLLRWHTADFWVHLKMNLDHKPGENKTDVADG